MTVQWKKINTKSTIYPYVLKTQDAIDSEEWIEMLDFCNQSFGKGGHLPTINSVWFFGISKDTFAFRHEDDMLAFYIAFCG